MAMAVTGFQATRISTLQLGSTTGTGGALAELQNTGLVITDIADSTYVHSKPAAPVIDTGYYAIVSAVDDGYDNGSGMAWAIMRAHRKESWASTRWVRMGAPKRLCDRVWHLNDLGLCGRRLRGEGLPFRPATSPAKALGDMLIRETYVGDANLDGTVDVPHDYTRWLPAI